MTNHTAAPVDNLVRAMFGRNAAELRAQTDDGGDGGTLFGHAAVFNQWTEIHSMWEGDFIERIAPGAFADTLADPARDVKVLYDHGQDPQLGNKPLGAIRSLREDRKGLHYEVDLLRGHDGALVPYNRDFIAPAAKAGLLGASFRFKVSGESWDESGDVKDYNPKGLPERTITRIDPLYELGPVTFPAYDSATAAVRSCGTDRFFDSLLNDDRFVARFRERVGPAIAAQIRAGLPPTVEAGPTSRTDAPTEPPVTPPVTADGGEEDTHQRRLEVHARSVAGFVAHLERLKETTP